MGRITGVLGRYAARGRYGREGFAPLQSACMGLTLLGGAAAGSEAERAGLRLTVWTGISGDLEGEIYWAIFAVCLIVDIVTAREFEISFRRLYLPLGMYALRIVDDADVAEDLVQDAFMRAWMFVEDGGVIDNFSAFMYRTVRNVCLSYLRDRREMLDESNIPEAGEEEIDTSFRDARIWKAIDELPEKCREVFLMSKRDGLTNEEIADELGISVKTVKNQMTKAFGRLREALSDGHRPFFLPFL